MQEKQRFVLLYSSHNYHTVVHYRCQYLDNIDTWTGLDVVGNFQTL
jgi:hypothetical protein